MGALAGTWNTSITLEGEPFEISALSSTLVGVYKLGKFKAQTSATWGKNLILTQNEPSATHHYDLGREYFVMSVLATVSTDDPFTQWYIKVSSDRITWDSMWFTGSGSGRFVVNKWVQYVEIHTESGDVVKSSVFGPNPYAWTSLSFNTSFPLGELATVKSTLAFDPDESPFFNYWRTTASFSFSDIRFTHTFYLPENSDSSYHQLVARTRIGDVSLTSTTRFTGWGLAFD